LINEIWKDAVGYEGIYEISNTGKVRTKEDKTTFTKRHGIRRWSQRTLKQKVSKDKTCRVSLWKDGKEKTWLVHRLVAFAYLPLVVDKDCVNHMDGNRMNNAVTNLEWCNHTENNNHAFDNKLIKTASEIMLINKETKEEHVFRSMARAGKFLNRNPGTISLYLQKRKKEIDGYEIKLK
jgi:hypothetical protein